MTTTRITTRAMRRGGFTLIELVLALAMVAIVAGALYASMHIAFAAAKSADLALAPSRTAELALDFVRVDIQSAMPPNTALSSSTQGATALAQDFQGTNSQDDRGHEADDVIFYGTSDAPDHPSGNGEIKKIEITMYRPDGGSEYVLVRRVTRNLLSQVTQSYDEEILCRGVTSFTLQYFDGSAWQPTWDSTAQDNTLPVAVQAVLELDPPAGSSSRQTSRFTRVFAISCSTAATDPNVNSQVDGL